MYVHSAVNRANDFVILYVINGSHDILLLQDNIHKSLRSYKARNTAVFLNVSTVAFQGSMPFMIGNFSAGKHKGTAARLADSLYKYILSV